MPRPVRQDTSSSLQRAFRLLDAFGTERRELSIRELARVSDVPRSTAHRLVQELLAIGALETGASGVRLGVRLFELGALVSRSAMLREVALPYAHDLGEVTKLTVNLAVLEGNEIVYVEKLSTRSLRVPHSRLGGRLSVHATALGKAILAYSDATAVATVIDGGLHPLTSRTITDEAALRAELAVVRRLGVAYDVEESQPGLFCVAAPILLAGNDPIGAISVTGATAKSHAARMAPAVQATSLAIARVLQSKLPGNRPVNVILGASKEQGG